MIRLFLVLMLLWCKPVMATDWCADANNAGCFLMEDSGNETDRSTVASGGDLTETGGTIPQSADKKFGTYSRDFELGDTEWLEHADGLSTDISGANAKISIVAWVKPESLTAEVLIVGRYGYGTSNRSYALSYEHSITKARFRISADGVATSLNLTTTTSISTASGWQHIAATSDDVNGVIYYNGVPETSAGYTSGIFAANTKFGIGAYPDEQTFHYDGLMDDVAVFSRALSSTDISTIYDYGLSPSSVLVGGSIIRSGSIIRGGSIIR